VTGEGARHSPAAADKRQAVISEISLALDRCLDPEYDVPEQVTRVVQSALNHAQQLPAAGQ